MNGQGITSFPHTLALHSHTSNFHKRIFLDPITLHHMAKPYERCNKCNLFFCTTSWWRFFTLFSPTPNNLTRTQNCVCLPFQVKCFREWDKKWKHLNVAKHRMQYNLIKIHLPPQKFTKCTLNELLVCLEYQQNRCVRLSNHFWTDALHGKKSIFISHASKCKGDVESRHLCGTKLQCADAVWPSALLFWFTFHS